jgi:hypothetical protein
VADRARQLGGEAEVRAASARAQRRLPPGRWLRWNDELISAQRSPRA